MNHHHDKFIKLIAVAAAIIAAFTIAGIVFSVLSPTFSAIQDAITLGRPA